MTEGARTPPRIGLSIWDQGGRLERALHMESLVSSLARMKNVARCEVCADIWSDGFLSAVREAVETGALNRLVWVGAFSPEQEKELERLFSDAGLNPFLHEWCNLSEQGVGGQGPDREAQTRKAATLIQMSVARARLLEPLERASLPALDSVCVVGAGVAGLHAASSLLKLGKRVHIVEKESGVGGRVARLTRLYPRMCDPACGLQFELQRLKGSDGLEIHTLSRIDGLDGVPGNFEVTIEKGPRFVSVERCNGCGECASVCPVPLPGPPSFGRPGKAIHAAYPMAFPTAFVVERTYCPPGCAACAAACPSGAIRLDEGPSRLAVRVGAVIVTTGWDPYPLARVEEYGYGVYPNVVGNVEAERLIEGAPGLRDVGFVQCAGSRDERHLSYCSSVCCSVALKQAARLKERLPEARLHIFYQDIRTPGFDEERYQAVKSLDGVTFVKGLPSAVRPEEDGRLRIRAEDVLSGVEVNVRLDLLVLAGGMVPSETAGQTAEVLGLPRNAYGFFESHLQCHPEENGRTGIYAGGTCLGPMSVAHSIESANRAVVEALQFLSERVLVEPDYPVLDRTKCDKCKRCMEDCPFSAFSFDADGFPAPDLGKCRRCGNCMGTCPLAAISLRHFTIRQTAAQIRAIRPSRAGAEPFVLAFLCKNDAYLAARAAASLGPIPANVCFIKVPCAGAVNNALLADALSFGIDGVLIAGCKDGQCHSLKGSELVRTRSKDLADKLTSMTIEPERVRFEAVEIRDSAGYVEILRSYVERLKALGPNPLKE